MRRGFDPTKRPRPPRSRSTKRRVAPLTFNPDFSDVDLEILSRAELQALSQMLGSGLAAQLDDDLQDIAVDYRRALNQLPHPRDEMRSRMG